ncbi:MAG TPA: hypothetical protein VIC59_09690 [Gemmatimonadota bacterium]|jgi:hypothetical protein
MRRFALVVAVGSALICFTRPSEAQQATPPSHVITVTTFQVPYTDVGKFWEMVDKYVVPSDKENPYILSERLASHNWGDSKKTVWFISEYENLGAVAQAGDWTNADFDKRYPEGSAARDSANTAFEEHFLKYFTEHEDNILSVNLKRAK